MNIHNLTQDELNELAALSAKGDPFAIARWKAAHPAVYAPQPPPPPPEPTQAEIALAAKQQQAAAEDAAIHTQLKQQNPFAAAEFATQHPWVRR